MASILLCFRENREKIAQIYLRPALLLIGKSLNQKNFPVVNVYELQLSLRDIPSNFILNSG